MSDPDTDDRDARREDFVTKSEENNDNENLFSDSYEEYNGQENDAGNPKIISNSDSTHLPSITPRMRPAVWQW